MVISAVDIIEPTTNAIVNVRTRAHTATISPRENNQFQKCLLY